MSSFDMRLRTAGQSTILQRDAVSALPVRVSARETPSLRRGVRTLFVRPVFSPCGRDVAHGVSALGLANNTQCRNTLLELPTRRHKRRPGERGGATNTTTLFHERVHVHVRPRDHDLVKVVARARAGARARTRVRVGFGFGLGCGLGLGRD